MNKTISTAASILTNVFSIIANKWIQLKSSNIE